MKHKDARANRSRQALINAGIQLLIQHPGAFLKEVAEAAGVGRATLYRHFDTREQLIQEIALESLEMTDTAMAPVHARNGTARETLCDMFRVLMPMADRYHFLLSLWSLAEEDKQVNDIYQQQLERLHELIERGKQQGSIRSDLNSDWVMVMIDTMIYSGWWLIGEGKCDAEQAANNAISTLLSGIGMTPD